MSARRKLEVRRILGCGTEHVSDAAHGVNERNEMAAVDLAAQAADMRLDHRGARFEVHIPHILEQHGTSHGLPEVLEQILEQLKLPRQKLDGDVGAADCSGQQV